MESATAPVVDLHVHLIGGSEGHTGCFISPGMRRHFAYRGLKVLLGISERDVQNGRADEELAQRIASLVEGAQGVDQAVLLALDGVHRRGDRHMDRTATSMYVPNDYLFEVCQRSPALLPGASVHPERPHAVSVLRDVLDRGAVLVKWLPPAQIIDASRREYVPFYELMAERGVPLLCHTSAERTFPSAAPQLEDPSLLSLPLQVGVTVIAAHSALGLLGLRRTDYQDTLLGMMDRFPNLYADNAALCSPARGHGWSRMLANPRLLSRMVHGSDYPIPCWPGIYIKRLGWRTVRSLSRIPNPIERDCATKRALGVPDEVFRRSHSLLGNPGAG